MSAVARGHEQAAPHHRAPRAEQAIGEQSAQERRRVDERRVGAVDRVGAAVVHAQEALEHVEEQQRPHAVVGEALPHLGEEQR